MLNVEYEMRLKNCFLFVVCIPTDVTGIPVHRVLSAPVPGAICYRIQIGESSG